MQKVPSLGWEDPLEEGMATHCSVLTWRIPWTEEPGRLQSMGVTKSWTHLKLLSVHTRELAGDWSHLQRRKSSDDIILLFAL